MKGIVLSPPFVLSALVLFIIFAPYNRFGKSLNVEKYIEKAEQNKLRSYARIERQKEMKLMDDPQFYNYDRSVYLNAWTKFLLEDHMKVQEAEIDHLLAGSSGSDDGSSSGRSGNDETQKHQ